MSRSPRYPSLSLPDALKYADQAYSSIGASSVDSATFVEALGYSSVSGASSKTFAALKYFGLAEGRGDDVKISDLYLRIAHPLNDREKSKAIREAGMNPEAFSSILNEHNPLPPEELLKSIAVRKLGFNDSGAKKFVSNLTETASFLERYEVVVSDGALKDDNNPVESDKGSADKNSNADVIASPASPVVGAATEHLKFKLSKELEADVYFYGQVDSDSIKRLIKHLEFTQEIYE